MTAVGCFCHLAGISTSHCIMQLAAQSDQELWPILGHCLCPWQATAFSFGHEPHQHPKQMEDNEQHLENICAGLIALQEAESSWSQEAPGTNSGRKAASRSHRHRTALSEAGTENAV